MLNRGFEFFQPHRFHQVRGKAGLEALTDIGVHAKTADCDSGDGEFRAQMPKKIHAISVRQADVADEEIKLIVFGGFYRSAHAVGRVNMMTAQREQPFQSRASVGMIVDQQDAKARRRRLSRNRSRSGGSLLQPDSFYGEKKRRAATAAFALRYKRSAVSLRERVGNRQTKAEVTCSARVRTS